MSNPSEVEIAWLAGLLEGEGTFTVNRKATSGRRASIRVGIEMTDLDVIKRASRLMGGTGHVHERKNRPDEYKAAYQVNVGGADAETVMRLVYPHMGERRKSRIESLLAMDCGHHPRLPSDKESKVEA